MPFGLTKARLGIFFCFIFCDKAKKIATVFFVILAIHFECKFKQKGLKFKHKLYCEFDSENSHERYSFIFPNWVWSSNRYMVFWVVSLKQGIKFYYFPS